MKVALKIFFLLLMISCVTYPYKVFDEIKTGMDKSDVLERLGSPIYVKEKSSKHVWLYRFYDESKNKIIKEVQFEDSRVTYAGEQKTFKKIINPNGASFSQSDLEDYLKKEEKKEEETIKSKPMQDTQSMEQEILHDLKPEEDGFVPVK